MGTLSERNPSLWVATSERPTYPALAGPVRADVAVIGSGITGLTTARLLAGEGASVAVVDAGEVCAGVTGYTTAKVTSLHSTIYSRLTKKWGQTVAATYAEANQAALATVRRLIAGDGLECDFVEAPAYTYAEFAGNVAAIEAEVEAASRAGLPVGFTTDTDLPYEVSGAVRLDGQGHFHPRRYCLGLARAIAATGGLVFERTRALDVEAGAVTTDRGVINAGAVVIATHLPFPLAGGYFARTEPQRSYALAGEPDPGHPVPQGMYISVDTPTRSVRPAPAGQVIVGGEGHKVGEETDTTARYETLRSWAKERFGISEAGYRWSAQDYQSADGLPLVGRLSPGGDGIFVATGYGKWGMTNGTVAAMILADLVQGRDNPWAAAFDSTRLAVRQGAGQVLRENAGVARHFVGDRLRTLHPPAADDLAPGQGGIVTIDGARVAAFRGDDGRVHAVDARCTHMGCQVAFNTAERTWDCPCHGSRFDVDGRLVQGPAVKDLEPVAEQDVGATGT